MLRLKHVKRGILVGVFVVIIICVCLVVKKHNDIKIERTTKNVSAEIGETLSVAWIVGSDIGKDAKISPKIVYASSKTNASVSEDGKLIYVGDTACEFEITVYWIDEKGKEIKNRFRISTGYIIED